MTGRIHTLTLLERLRRNEMVNEVRELAALRAQVDSLNRACTELLETLQTEARIVTIEAAPYVGAYIRAIRDEVARKERAAAQHAPRIAELEHSMLDRFREVATVRMAIEKTRSRARTADAVRVSGETNEQALLGWSRRRKARRPPKRGETSPDRG